MLNFETVLVWAVITEYHRLGGLSSKHLFLTVLETGSLRSGCQHDQGLVKALFLVYRVIFSLCPHTEERETIPLVLLLTDIILVI